MAPTIVDLTDDSPPASPATPKPTEPAAPPSPSPAPAPACPSSATPVMENQLDQLRRTPEQQPPQPDPKRFRLSEELAADVPRPENNIAVPEPDSLYSYYRLHGGLKRVNSSDQGLKQLIIECTNSKPPAENLGGARLQNHETPPFLQNVVPDTRIAMRGPGGAPLIVPASTFFEKADRETGGDHIPRVGSSGSWMPAMDESAQKYLGSSLPRVRMLMDLLEGEKGPPQRQMFPAGAEEVIPAAALSRVPVPQRETLILFPLEIPFFPVTPHERAREELRIAAMGSRAGQGTSASAYKNAMTVCEDRESVGDNGDEEIDLELSLSL